MPKRQREVTHYGGPQGDDAFVKVRHRTVAESKEIFEEGQALRKALAANEDVETLAKIQNRANEILVDFVVDWNWVDDEDKPLPKPDKPEVFDLLITPEVVWLTELAGGTLSDEKKRN